MWAKVNCCEPICELNLNLGLIRKSHKNKVHPLCNLLFSNIKLSKLRSDNKRGIFANLCMIYAKFIVLVKNYDPYTSWSRKLIGRSWHERGIQDKNNNLIYMALHFWMEFFYERWLFELRHEKFEYNLNRYQLQISLPHWGKGESKGGRTSFNTKIKLHI